MDNLEISGEEIKARGIRFSIRENDKEIARAYLYLMHNDLHEEPFGLMEDVFVEESHRRQGIASRLVQEIIDRAREEGCYKLLATTRHSKPKVQEMYLNLGFQDWGSEFRINL